MLHLRRFTGFSIKLECWNAFRFGQWNKFWKKSLRKKEFETSKFEYSQGPLGEVLRISPESTPQGRPLNVRLRRPMDVILGCPQGVRLERPRDVRSGRPWDGQIGSLGDVVRMLEGDVLATFRGPIFAGWVETMNIHISLKMFD